MKVTKKQPDTPIELISTFPTGSIFRMKTKNTLEQDLVEGNILMKVSAPSETKDGVIESCNAKTSFVRLGNKFELIHRTGPFMGSLVEIKSIELIGEKKEKELTECSGGDIVSFESFSESKFLVIHDPVEDKGFISLVRLDSTLKATSIMIKVDKQVPCTKFSAEIVL